MNIDKSNPYIKNQSRKQYLEQCKQERTGETKINVHGTVMTIIDYHNSDNVIVQFENGYTTRTAYAHFKKGNIKSPYDKTVYGFGFLGVGNYQSHISSKKRTPAYNTWMNMMRRCYSEEDHLVHPTYRQCSVCEEWHNFQNFAVWYEKNYYVIQDEIIDLDKDILVKHNKIYSPDTCIFVPHSINSLLIKSDAMRGNLPLGVCSARNGKYRARCNNGQGVVKFLGHFDNSEEAFYAYKTYKEQVIRQKADEYKNAIPKKLYDALHNYIVEITD